MTRSTLILPLALVGGFAVAALLTTISGGDAGTEATAHAVTRGPVPCGSNAVIEVYLDSLDARTSDLGQPVGLGAFSVVLHYPNDALRPAASGGAVTPADAETVDGTAGRQWIAPPRNGDGDVFHGEFGFGAFSYIGPANPSGDVADVAVTEDLAARERAGIAIMKDAPLLLGTFELVTGKTGMHQARIELELVDSSNDVASYSVNSVPVEIEVTDGPCAKFAEIDPPPTYPPAPPPWEGWDKIPTPDPYPDDITPTTEFDDLGDACESGQPYTIVTRGIDLCLPPRWAVQHDPSPEQVETARLSSPNALASALFERESPEGITTAEVSVTILGGEPYSLTKCEFPVTIPDLGTVCMYARGPRGHLMEIYWRLIGVTTKAGQWVTIAVHDTKNQEEMEQAQREALELVQSMRGGY